MWLYSWYLKGASRGMQGTSGVVCENVFVCLCWGVCCHSSGKENDQGITLQCGLGCVCFNKGFKYVATCEREIPILNGNWSVLVQWPLS